MTLDEAIRQNKETVEEKHTNLCAKQDAAILLGIEALKKIKLWRQDNVYPDYTLLPGETEE